MAIVSYSIDVNDNTSNETKLRANLLSLWRFISLDISRINWQRLLILLYACRGSVLRAKVRSWHGEGKRINLFKQRRGLFNPIAGPSTCQNWIVVITLVLLWIIHVVRNNIRARLCWLRLIGHILLKNYLWLVLSLGKNETLVVLRAIEQHFWDARGRVVLLAGVHHTAVRHGWCELLRSVFLSCAERLYHGQLATAHDRLLIRLQLPERVRSFAISSIFRQFLSVALRCRVGRSWKPGL